MKATQYLKFEFEIFKNDKFIFFMSSEIMDIDFQT